MRNAFSRRFIQLQKKPPRVADIRTPSQQTVCLAPPAGQIVCLGCFTSLWYTLFDMKLVPSVSLFAWINPRWPPSIKCLFTPLHGKKCLSLSVLGYIRYPESCPIHFSRFSLCMNKSVLHPPLAAPADLTHRILGWQTLSALFCIPICVDWAYLQVFLFSHE